VAHKILISLLLLFIFFLLLSFSSLTFIHSTLLLLVLLFYVQVPLLHFVCLWATFSLALHLTHSCSTTFVLLFCFSISSWDECDGKFENFSMFSSF
jgi:hypothetical protein